MEDFSFPSDLPRIPHIKRERKKTVDIEEYLNVPFDEKNEAKQLGARWSGPMKKWYIHSDLSSEAKQELKRRWGPRDEIDDLPGEDRSYKGNDICVDIIPSSSPVKPLKYMMDSSDYDRLRDFITARSRGLCELCGESVKKASHKLHPVPRYSYRPNSGTQVLKRIVDCCSDCAEASTLGYKKGPSRDRAGERIMQMLDMTKSEFGTFCKNVWDKRKERNEINWTPNMEILINAGINVIYQAEEDD
jgi:hypothetical protein